MFCCSIAGSVLLGNPRSDQQIIIPGYSHTSVRALEASSTTPDQLALGLADILFTKDELSSSLVTQKEGRNLLDPDRVEGIRRKIILLSEFFSILLLHVDPEAFSIDYLIREGIEHHILNVTTGHMFLGESTDYDEIPS